MNRQNVIASISEMPQSFELEELIERLVVLEKIERGRQDVKDGNKLSHAAARKELTSIR